MVLLDSDKESLFMHPEKNIEVAHAASICIRHNITLNFIFYLTSILVFLSVDPGQQFQLAFNVRVTLLEFEPPGKNLLLTDVGYLELGPTFGFT